MLELFPSCDVCGTKVVPIMVDYVQHLHGLLFCVIMAKFFNIKSFWVILKSVLRLMKKVQFSYLICLHADFKHTCLGCDMSFVMLQYCFIFLVSW